MISLHYLCDQVPDIIPVSAETGEGFDAAADWIRAAVREWLDR